MSIPQFYLDDIRFSTQMAAYRQYIQRVVQFIARDAHSNQTKEQMFKDVEDIIEFEKQFARITVENTNTGNFSIAFRASRLSDVQAYVPSASSQLNRYYDCLHNRA